MVMRKAGAVTAAAIAALMVGGCTFRDQPEPTPPPAIYAPRENADAERVVISAPRLDYEARMAPAPAVAPEPFTPPWSANAQPSVTTVYVPFDHDAEALEPETEPEEECGCPEDFTVSQDAEQPGPTLTYLGSFQVYGYDLCLSCCGKTDGITASGTQATVGRTVAAKGIPYGTRLYIEGIGERVVEDTGGMAAGVIDVLCNNHSECYAITGKYDVYIIEAAEQSETAPGVAAPEAVTK